MDEICSSIKGIYRDVLRDRDNKIIFDSGWVPNLIVDRCRILLAAFMKNDGSNGIRCIKVGIGNPDWDNTGAPMPDTSEIGLVDQAHPFTIDVEALELVYLNENDQQVTGPTTRLQITATLGTDQPLPPDSNLSTYPLREFGLFGQYGNDEYMIDCIRHPVIHKDVSSTLIRVVRLYF
jgi:hypothetical protein